MSVLNCLKPAGDTIVFYAPGSRHYDNGLFVNNRGSFVNISVTGTACQCKCEHCNGRLLDAMLAVDSPHSLRRMAYELVSQGCRGVLISGGACRQGEVPLAGYGPALLAMKTMGLSVVVHPGLLTAAIAAELAQAGVERVALDLIGDADTISRVYHLRKTPDDYRRSLALAREAGLKVSPHIVVGLHFGEIKGEYEALDMVAQAGADSLVLVVLTPLPGTNMAGVQPPAESAVIAFFKTARRLLPNLPLALGCARPAGQYARRIERAAVELGFKAIAYPARETVEYAVSRGLSVSYREVCCGLLIDGKA